MSVKSNNDGAAGGPRRPAGWRRAWPLAAGLLAGLALASCSDNKQSALETAAGSPAATDVYTCPMHPDILRHAPGDCPVCGMHLVKKAGGPPAGAARSPAPPVAQTDPTAVVPAPNEQVLSRVRLVRPARTAVAETITAPGAIGYDPRRFENVAARFGGRIERLYVRYQFQPVRAGQKLYDIYSPELVTEQQNLLFLLRNRDPDDQALLNASRQKLRLLGLSAAQVRAVEQRGQPQLRLSVYSPAGGYVLETAAPAQAPPGAGPGTSPAPPSGGQGPGTAALEQAAPLALREGQYVERGQGVFQVVNTDRVWARLQFYARDVAGVRPGMPVQITLNDQPQAAPLRARIALLEPVLAGDAATATARVYLPNPGGRLRIGQLVTARLATAAGAGLWVPATAVVDLGTQQVVFRQQPHSPRLRAVPVVTGPRSGTQIRITQGLGADDQIAENGQYLVDSESFIKPVADVQK